MEISAATGSVAYLELLEQLMLSGTVSSPRGLRTTEIRDVTLRISQPSEIHVLSTHRNPAPKIAATEAVHLIGGLSSLEQLDAASGGRFSQFADGGRLRGAYGPRTYAQMERVAGLLDRDPDTRQAVVTVWRGDEGSAGHDVPCTLSYQFTIRDGQLNLRTSMRSNDAWLGIPYDLEVAGCLLWTMAGVLGVAPGEYTHTVGSAHVYAEHAGDVAALTAAGICEQKRQAVPAIEPLPLSNSPAASKSSTPERRWRFRRKAAQWLVLRTSLIMPEVNTWHARHVPLLPPPSDEWVLCACRYVVDGDCEEECD